MLEVKNLVFHPLENGLEKSIIEDVSFTVEDGEMLVITGPNGGGKSTLAKLMMGIETPDEGSIFMVRISVIIVLMSGQMQELVLPFSSRPDLKE